MAKKVPLDRLRQISNKRRPQELAEHLHQAPPPDASPDDKGSIWL